MNKEQRKKLENIIARMEELQGEIATAASDIQAEAEAEREKFDNLNEGLQASERGQALETAADALDNAQSEFEEAESQLEEAIGSLQSALES